MRQESTPKKEIGIQACGRAWHILREDLDKLWQDMTNEDNPLWEDWLADERLPYWADLWPSSLALAEFLHQRRAFVRGKDCLDLGCGLGFTALVGSWLGARMIGMDYDRNAIAYAAMNAEHNQITNVQWLQSDWRDCDLDEHSQDLIWAADIVYEQRFAVPVLAFIKRVLKPEGTAWIAEPGREVFGRFRAEVAKSGFTIKKIRTETVQAYYAQPAPVPINIWELRGL